MTIEGNLVASSNRGRCAIGAPSGVDVTAGVRIDVQVGDHWISGIVEYSAERYVNEDRGEASTQRGYYFISDSGDVCGLCIGMRVRMEG